MPETPLIPRETLFGNPVNAQPRLSPGGGRLAYLAPLNGVLNVWVGSFGDDNFEPVTKDTHRGIRAYFWTWDGRHVVYLQDKDGDENWRLYAVDLEAGGTRNLTPFENVQARLIARSKRFPGDLVVSLNDRDPRMHDAYRLNVESGELELAAENPGNVAGWVADAEFSMRGAETSLPDGGLELLVRSNEGEGWEKIITWGREDSLNSGPVGFTEDGDRMYLLDSREANTARLVRMELSTGGDVEVLLEDPHYDVSDVLIHPDTGEVQAAAVEGARTGWAVLDERIREDFEAIEHLSRGDFGIVSRDRPDENWIVAFTLDEGGASYYAYDRNSRTGEHLFDAYPDLKGYTLARMRPISFTSRDGLEIEGYLTLPPGVEARDLPMVLNVHGGPWARDSWGYNPEAQWLANRGYACLQVNYRGSTGYGKGFLNAGDRQWGVRMHDDLVDAVSWAVDEGIADPDKVAIFGGSYGGYAALAGATFTPDLFRCAVDIVGPSNLVTLIKSVPPYWEPIIAQFHERVGNPDTEEEFLKSRSPLFYAENIKIPLLIAQGANDPRVKQAEAEQIVAALQEKGLDYEYLLFEDEGHGFARPENRLKFYAAAERFLARHLGGRMED